MLIYNGHNFIGVGPGGQGVEPPVRKKFEQPVSIGGIKFWLGQVSLIWTYCYGCAISQNMSIFNF
jgi:hypothetical protein